VQPYVSWGLLQVSRRTPPMQPHTILGRDGEKTEEAHCGCGYYVAPMKHSVSCCQIDQKSVAPECLPGQPYCAVVVRIPAQDMRVGFVTSSDQQPDSP
jgi:hypothetical protein